MRKNLAVIAITVILSFLFVKKGISEFANRLSFIRSYGLIKVGVSPEYVPFEYKNEKGEIVGFDVDIAKKLAEALHADLKIKEYKWSDLILALKNGEIDIIISGMTRTLDRALDVNFTDPYFQTGQVVVVNEKYKDLEHCDKLCDALDKKEIKVAVVKKTTGEETARKKLSNVTFVVFKGEAEASSALITDKVDAFVFDKPFADFLVIQNPKLNILTEQLSYEYYSFAIAKGDPDFLRWLDYFISELKLSGEYNKLYNYWFKDQTWKVPNKN